MKNRRRFRSATPVAVEVLEARAMLSAVTPIVPSSMFASASMDYDIRASETQYLLDPGSCFVDTFSTTLSSSADHSPSEDGAWAVEHFFADANVDISGFFSGYLETFEASTSVRLASGERTGEAGKFSGNIREATTIVALSGYGFGSMTIAGGAVTEYTDIVEEMVTETRRTEQASAETKITFLGRFDIRFRMDAGHTNANAVWMDPDALGRWAEADVNLEIEADTYSLSGEVDALVENRYLLGTSSMFRPSAFRTFARNGTSLEAAGSNADFSIASRFEYAHGSPGDPNVNHPGSTSLSTGAAGKFDSFLKGEADLFYGVNLHVGLGKQQRETIGLPSGGSFDESLSFLTTPSVYGEWTPEELVIRNGVFARLDRLSDLLFGSK